jgi:PAS domain S-box-containing protein
MNDDSKNQVSSVRAEKEMQRAMAETEQSAQRLQATLEQMYAGVLVCDERGQLTSVNKSANKLFGDAAVLLNDLRDARLKDAAPHNGSAARATAETAEREILDQFLFKPDGSPYPFDELP